MKLDILAIGVHPDDVELGCGGTLLQHLAKGYKVGILDLTKGELGTRGSATLRTEEANEAARIMGIDVRVQLDLADGFFENDKESQLEIIKVLRQYQPDIVLANAKHDRHPDHGRAGTLTSDACFLAGLPKIETQVSGKLQEAFKPKSLYHYIQAKYIEPDFVVDISEVIDKKMEAVGAYKSQFFDPSSNEDMTFISSPEFIESVSARAIEMGTICGFHYAEGFVASRRVGVRNLFDLA